MGSAKGVESSAERTDCPLGPLRSFHIPKTGSSFSSLVWAYGCVDAAASRLFRLRVVGNDRRVRNHVALGKNHDVTTNLANISRLVTRQLRCPCLHEPTRLQQHYHHEGLTRATSAAAVPAAGLFRQPGALPHSASTDR